MYKEEQQNDEIHKHLECIYHPNKLEKIAILHRNRLIYGPSDYIINKEALSLLEKAKTLNLSIFIIGEDNCDENLYVIRNILINRITTNIITCCYILIDNDLCREYKVFISEKICEIRLADITMDSFVHDKSIFIEQVSYHLLYVAMRIENDKLENICNYLQTYGKFREEFNELLTKVNSKEEYLTWRWLEKLGTVTQRQETLALTQFELNKKYTDIKKLGLDYMIRMIYSLIELQITIKDSQIIELLWLLGGFTNRNFITLDSILRDSLYSTKSKETNHEIAIRLAARDIYDKLNFKSNIHIKIKDKWIIPILMRSIINNEKLGNTINYNYLEIETIKTIRMLNTQKSIRVDGDIIAYVMQVAKFAEITNVNTEQENGNTYLVYDTNDLHKFMKIVKVIVEENAEIILYILQTQFREFDKEQDTCKNHYPKFGKNCRRCMFTRYLTKSLKEVNIEEYKKLKFNLNFIKEDLDFYKKGTQAVGKKMFQLQILEALIHPRVIEIS